MSISTDIATMYRRPAEVFRRKLAGTESEPKALAHLMGACAFMFVAQLPVISRRVSLSDPDRWAAEPGAYSAALQPEMGGALLATMILMPLILYALAALMFLILRVVRVKITGYQMRLVLFWTLLAAAPLALLNGLTQGFVGEGTASVLVGLLWCLVAGLFVATGVRQAHKLATPTAGEAA